MSKPIWIAKAYLQNYDFFSLSAVAEAYNQGLKELTGITFNYKYESSSVFYDQNNIDSHVSLLEKQPELIEKQINFIKEKIKSLQSASKKYGKKKDASSLDLWYKEYFSFLPSLGLVFGIEEYLEKKVKSFLSEEDFHKMGIAEETETAEEQKSILTLALLPYNSEEFRLALAEHLKNFSWLGNKMMTYSPFTKEQILERAMEARKDAQIKLSEMENNRKSIKEESDNVISSLTKEQNSLILYYQSILYLRTARAEAISQSSSLIHPLLSSIARDLVLTRHELLRFSEKEILDMIKTKEKKNADDRKSYSALMVDGNFEVIWGESKSEDNNVNNEEISELHGITACKGQAKGIVKIIREHKDIEKFDKGDILVAPYTNPNLIKIMEKAAAIITDIGGLTSHAAIISRELNIPCIIGTNTATKLLKDGDLVEVNADAGTVKVLK